MHAESQWSAPLRKLMDENDDLRAENIALRKAMGAFETDEFVIRCKERLGLRKSSARLLHILMVGKAKNKQAIWRAYCGFTSHRPEIKIIEVLICHLRRALQPHGITIKTDWAIGYSISPADRVKLDAIINADEPARMAAQ